MRTFVCFANGQSSCRAHCVIQPSNTRRNPFDMFGLLIQQLTLRRSIQHQQLVRLFQQ